MGNFCIGAYGRILLSGCKSTVKKKQLAPLLMAALDEEYQYQSESTYDHIMDGRQELNPAWVDKARSSDVYAVAAYFRSKLGKLMNESLRQHVVYAMKRMILDDDSLAQNTALLYEVIGMTPEELEEENNFFFDDFMAKSFLYACQIEGKNDNNNAFLRTITRKWYEQYEEQAAEIRLLKGTAIIPSEPVELTVVKDRFDKTFTEIHAEKLRTPNASDLKIYCVTTVEANQFAYENLYKLLRLNLGSYVFSRMDMRGYTGPEQMLILDDAIDKMWSHGSPGEKGSGTDLGEIMLYMFLEYALGAPKLLTRIEIKESDSRYGGGLADSIHLLTSSGKVPFNQRVFGISHMAGDLNEAINMAFDRVLEMTENEAHRGEIKLADSALFNGRFSREETETLRKILRPEKELMSSPQSAFGLFLGYTPEIEDRDNLSNKEFINNAVQKMREDIFAALPRIQKIIKDNSLGRYSFYIYLVPFNDVLSDSEEIMKRILKEGRS